MIKEKQIDEMAKLICNYPHCTNYNVIGECVNADCMFTDKAEAIYNADYRKQSEWISVEERLPEKDGCYITYTNAKGSSNGVIAQSLVTRTIRGIKVRRWEWQTKISPWIVTHWMPLPEAPKMKGGAE